MRLRLLLVAALVAPVWTSTPAEAAYVPSCTSGVAMPQLCTLVTAIGLSGFGPRDKAHSYSTGRLAARAYQGPSTRCTSGARIPQQEFGGGVAGDLRGFWTVGDVATHLRGCTGGENVIQNTSTIYGVADLADGRKQRMSRTLWVTVRQDANAGPRIALSWVAQITECPRSSDVCYYRYRETGSTPSAPITIRNTGVEFSVVGSASVTRGPSGTLEQHQVTYRANGSISGHWSRLRFEWLDSAGPQAALAVATAPSGAGWRSQLARMPDDLRISAVVPDQTIRSTEPVAMTTSIDDSDGRLIMAFVDWGDGTVSGDPPPPPADAYSCHWEFPGGPEAPPPDPDDYTPHPEHRTQNWQHAYAEPGRYTITFRVATLGRENCARDRRYEDEEIKLDIRLR